MNSFDVAFSCLVCISLAICLLLGSCVITFFYALIKIFYK